VAAPVAAVLALIVVDLITGGNAHLTRSVVHAHGSEGLTDVFTRRLRAAAAPLQRPGPALVFVAALAGVAWLAARRQSVLGALASVRGGDQVRAGIIGAFFAVAAGTLANDSGPLILEIGAALLALTALYAAAPPEQA
jgi:hypothetical protein